MSAVDLKALDVQEAVKRVSASAAMLIGLLDSDLLVLRDRFQAFDPEGNVTLGKHKQKALGRVFARMEDLGIDPEMVAPTEEQVDENFKPLELADDFISQCFIFELVLGQPSFAKRIPADEVIKTLVQIGAGENTVVDNIPEQETLPGTVKTAKVKAKTLAVRQTLIDPDELNDFEANTRDMKKFLNRLAIPSSILAKEPRKYLIHVRDYEDVMQEFDAFKARREEFIDTLQERWEEVLEAAREDRGEFFRETDYKSFAAYRDGFRCNMNTYPVEILKELEKMAPALYNQEVQRVRLEAATELQALRDFLRAKFQWFMEGLVDMLTPDETGKAKRFSSAKVNGLREFIQTLGDFDLTGDSRLAKMAEEAGSLLGDVDPGVLKKNDAVRQKLQAAFSEQLEKARTLVVTRTRKLNLAAAED